ncbi:MAG TPA: GNAT family N-acetyltransferase, partial [Chitinophagaceae bacterium]|nr:GNAT family N-acetyltransferase [Chitinophagaceae bacterium]
RGIMHETIQQVISFGFNTMQLKTIIAYTSSANMKSRLLLEKNKFRFYKNTKTDEKNKTEYAIYKLRRRKA